MMTGWIDTHVHMDAPQYADPHAVRRAAQAAGVSRVVIPAINPGNFDIVRQLAHAHGDGYALGIHPMYLPPDADAALTVLDQTLQQNKDDPHLLAIGEIGLDFFEPHLCTDEMRALQEYYFAEQLKLARKYNLPVILHTRRSVDRVFKFLRQTPPGSGIAHAFTGSLQQAKQAVDLGLKLGFGGAVTFDRATRLRQLARALPLGTLVMETDAPDIPPTWLYVTGQERRAGASQGINSSAELPRIGQLVADLRGISAEALCKATAANAQAAFPRLQHLCADITQ